MATTAKMELNSDVKRRFNKITVQREKNTNAKSSRKPLT